MAASVLIPIRMNNKDSFGQNGSTGKKTKHKRVQTGIPYDGKTN